MFPVGAAALELAVAGLMLLLSRAPGWRPLRWFSLICASAATYTLTNLGYRGLVPDAWLPMLFRLDLMSIGVHTAAWMIYSRRLLRTGSEQVERVSVGMMMALVLLAQVPGLACTDELIAGTPSWLGIQSKVPRTTTFGLVIVAAGIGMLALAARNFLQGAKHDKPLATFHIAAFGLFLPTVGSEVLAVLGLFSLPPLVDVGFLCTLAVVAVGLTDAFTKAVTRTIQAEAVLGDEVRARDAALEETQAHLKSQERLIELGSLAATIGHEINNPITYVHANLAYARESVGRLADPPADVTQALDDAVAGAERIGVIVKDLAWFARAPQSGEEKLVSLSFGEALEEALRLTAPIVRQRAVLELGVDPSLPRVQSPGTGMVQVLVNLILSTLALANAQPGPVPLRIRATRVGDGQVLCTITTDETKRTSVSLPSASGEWMPHEGMTLGLSVVRRILARVGGFLQPLEHPPGFRVVLPPVSPVTHTEPLQEVRRSLRLLVIDDEPLVLRALSRTLRCHNVRTCLGAEEAIEALAMEGWDVVVCDLMMPDVTGMELHARVAQSDPALASKFVFLTGGATTQEARAFLEEPGRVWLAKPVDPDTLLATLDSQAKW